MQQGKGSDDKLPSTVEELLSRIEEPEAPLPEPDDHTKSEQEDIDYKRQDALLKGLLQDIEERKTYARRIYRLICGWLIAVFILVYFHGAKLAWMGHFVAFELPESVLIALVTTTTINIIGIFVVVANYLFETKKKKKKNDTE